MLQLPKLYVITDRSLSGLTHAEMTRTLLDAGVTFIQLREKQLSSRDFYEEALKCVRLTRGAGCRVIINDRADIAMAVKADGVHVGQTDLDPIRVRRLVGPRMIIGWSSHTVAEAVQGEHLPVDYLALGPLFPTGTKKAPHPVLGVEAIRAVRTSVGKPLVAIGGINLDNCSDVFNAGATAIAVISAIWTAADLRHTIARFLQM